MANANGNNQGILDAALMGLGVIGGLVTAKKNRDNQNEQNRLDREHENWILDKQRQWALDDWAMQNEYNSPAQQMRRLKEAGLNPHLIYGKGAENTAGAIARTSSQPSSKPSYNFDANLLPNAAMGFINARLNAAQTDNVEQQTAIGKQEELLKAAQTAKTLTDNARGKFDLQQAEQLHDAVILRAQLENEKIDTDIDLALNNDARQELANSTNVTLTINKILTEEQQRLKLQLENAMKPAEQAKLNAEIQNIEQMRKNAEIEGYVKKYDALLLSKGYDRRDKEYMRMLMLLIKSGHEAIDQVPNK